MNQIAETQNAGAQQKLLGAATQVYSRAMVYLVSQFGLTVVLPAIGAFAAFYWHPLRPYVALFSLASAVADATILDRSYRRLLRLAAKIKEQFDCTVLDIPWSRVNVGSPVEYETIHEWGTAYDQQVRKAQLKDWYPKIVAGVPLHQARIICQRTNLWYDSKLRRRYGEIILIGSIGIVLALVVLGLMHELTVGEFVLNVMAPAAPILIWSAREYYRQIDTAEMLDQIRREAEALWIRARDGGCSSDDCSRDSRELQTAIYVRRATSPLIFPMIYKWLRPALEAQMNEGAEQFVRELRGAD